MKNIIKKIATVCGILILSSCSIEKMALNKMSDMLSSAGSSSENAFMTDTDYQFVGQSLPFAIKMYESLRNVNPTHYGLNVMTGSLYVMYANAFIELPMQILKKESNFNPKVKVEQQRAKAMYLKGANMILNYLDTMKQFNDGKGNSIKAKFSNPAEVKKILANMKKTDMDAFYWVSAGMMAAYSLDPMDFELSSKVGSVIEILKKLYEMDKTYGDGSVQDILALIYTTPINYDLKTAEAFAKEEIALSKGATLGPYLTYANILVAKKDYVGAYEQLQKAMSIPLEKYPSKMLLNTTSKMKIELQIPTIKELADMQKEEKALEEEMLKLEQEENNANATEGSSDDASSSQDTVSSLPNVDTKEVKQ